MKESIFGPMYRFCPVCRVYIHIENVHTEDDCWLLQQNVAPERGRITVPEVFYMAFGEENSSE